MGSFIKSTNFTHITYFGFYECLENEAKRRFVAFLLHSVLINSGRTGWIFFSGECIAEEKSFASVLDAQFCSTHCNLCAAPAPQPVPCPTCAAARSPPCRGLQNVEDLKIGKFYSTLAKAPRYRHCAQQNDISQLWFNLLTKLASTGFVASSVERKPSLRITSMSVYCR